MKSLSAPAAVRARGFGWRYAGRRGWALRELSLDIAPGERVLLLGASGSGKSTLLAGLAGLHHGQDSGEAVGELDIDDGPAWLNRHRAGLLLQDPDSQLVMSRVGDDVAFGPENYGIERNRIWPTVDEALSLASFPYGRERPTSALSGGEKQRLALAGVLACAPGLLLLDEPTANLDPASAQELANAVARALDETGATLIVVEHRVDLWLGLIQRVIVLDTSGGLLADGPPATVFNRWSDLLSSAGVWLPRTAGSDSRSKLPLCSAEASPLVWANGVAFTYRGAARPAVEMGDLRLNAGELVAIEGPSGSGKSTFAMMVAGLARPSSGDVRFEDGGRPLHRWRAKDLARRVGTVFQNPEHQFVRRTVRDELLVAPNRLGWNSAQTATRVDEMLDRLRLKSLARANPFTLSGGQQRRLSVATALIAAPELLVLDEPTFGQDANTWLELVDLLTAARDAGTALLVVSHDRDFSATVADRRIAMVCGGLRPVFCGESQPRHSASPTGEATFQ